MAGLDSSLFAKDWVSDFQQELIVAGSCINRLSFAKYISKTIRPSSDVIILILNVSLNRPTLLQKVVCIDRNGESNNTELRYSTIIIKDITLTKLTFLMGESHTSSKFL